MTDRAVREAAATRSVVGSPNRLAAVAGLAAVGALVGALELGGGAPEAVIAGLPDAGALVGWALPVVRLGARLVSVAVIGLLVLAAWLLPANAGRARTRAMVLVRRLAWTWLGLIVMEVGLTIAQITATPLPELGSEAFGIGLGLAQVQALGVQALLVVAVLLRGSGHGSLRAPRWPLWCAGLALLPPTLVGHVAAGPGADLVPVGLLAVHVLAAAVWVGGLAAALWVRTDGLGTVAAAVGWFSPIALGCAGAVIASGLAEAVFQLDSVGALVQSGYGQLLLVKTVAVVALVCIGRVHRVRTLPALRAGSTSAFLRLASVEVVVMAATVGVAIALSQSPQ